MDGLNWWCVPVNPRPRVGSFISFRSVFCLLFLIFDVLDVRLVHKASARGIFWLEVILYVSFVPSHFLDKCSIQPLVERRISDVYNVSI